MNACLIVLGAILGCSGGTAVPQETDAWVAEDKIRHFTASAAATTMGYGGARLLLEPPAARTAAAVTAVGLGLGKELLDAHRGGRISLKDIAWNAAGVALGIALIDRIR